ncbi:aminoglycoside adenylyltransferase domain-containing protein [Phytoactinopolyspora endophytica]|uniref:aminoglycoside adenylyltransferase domain-containing protein n=1 Tax=Phytoactinopolyspora endophytica TaxID=1642495 RepID=UPI0013EBCE93|nr:aminoglycoside adenylyltransferase domain-containing protein [Phytoactinopolyspora endophytica]
MTNVEALDALSQRYVGDVASVMSTVLGPELVGVYLHGSAALGGYDPRRSDVDILVVSKGPLTATQQSAAGERLAQECLPCPAHGLELSVVTLPITQHPTAQPAFELHVTTAPEDTKIVDGRDHDGDPDLILHFAVCRTAGIGLGPGPAAAEVFAPVAEELVRAQLLAELYWAAEHASNEYAVLNACRAWRYAAEHTLVSKIDGGQWALDHTEGPDHVLITAALHRQRSLPGADLDPAAARRFTQRIAAHLAESS